MRKFYETEWFGIQFNSFEKLNAFKQANENFYSKFYTEFFKKFKSYEDLPFAWKESKQQLVEFIFKKIKNKSNVLSIGCGNGFIENELSKKEWGGQLIAIEPSDTSMWLNDNKKIKLIKGYFPNDLVKQTNISLAYISYLDYVFNDKEYTQMLNDIKSHSIKSFLLIGASVYEPNNSYKVKVFIKNVLSIFNLYSHQLWGYQRTIEEHIKLFNRVGFSKVEYGQLDNGTYWIMSENE